MEAQEKCEHPFIRKVVMGQFKGVVTLVKCAVGHLFDDGSFKPQCWRCPACGKWITYEQRNAMMKRALLERRKVMTEIKRDKDTITIQFTYEEASVIMKLLAQGQDISCIDRDTIFDRFYDMLFNRRDNGAATQKQGAVD